MATQLTGEVPYTEADGSQWAQRTWTDTDTGETWTTYDQLGPAPAANPAGGMEFVNPAIEGIKAQLAIAAAEQAYRMARLDLDREQFRFMSELEKEKLALQKAQQAFETVLREAELTGYYTPEQTMLAAADYILQQRPDVRQFSIRYG